MSEKTAPLYKKIFVSSSIILICFLFDRLTKIYTINFFITNNLDNYYINDFLNLSLIWNKGIAFGLLQSENSAYHFISIFILAIIIFIIYLIFKTKKKYEMVFFSVIAGGAAGNLFDRFFYNAVPDFIDLHYNEFHWFIFNISDVLISIGILLLVIFDIIRFKEKS